MKSMKLLISVVLCVTVLTGGCQHDNKKTPSQKEQATKQWNTARAAVLASLAQSQYESGNFDKAQQTIDQALAMDPENPTLHILNARLAIEQSQLEQGKSQLDIAIKLDPKNAEADYLSGVIYQRWQKPEVAYDCYLRASQKNPEELAYILARAEMLVAMNCSDEAIDLLQRKVPYFEHNPVLYHAIGQLLADRGKYTEAVAALRQASALAPEDATIREHLAMAYFQNHQFREAGDLYTRILKEDANTKRADLWLALGECQMQNGRAMDARGSFDTATQLSPASTAAWLNLTKVTLQLGDLRRAEMVLRKAMSLDSTSSECHLMLGYIRLRESRLPEALGEFQKASALDQKDSVSLCMVGYVLEKSGKPDQAMKYYAQALKIKPNDELASKLMASIDLAN